MEKKKRKQHKEHGVVRIQGEGPAQACELNRKQELVGAQEPITVKKRKRDKTGERTKPATEVADDSNVREMLTSNAVCVQNEGEQHVINCVTEQKTRSNMGITDHVIAMLAQTQEKKKKKKKKQRTDQREHDSYCVDQAKDVMHISDEDDMLFNFSSDRREQRAEKLLANNEVSKNAKDVMHISDEDDMLFNFSTQPKANIVDHREPHVNSDRREQRAEKLLANDEVSKNKKKKKKRDHHKESTPHTEENDMVFNFVTQPAVANTVDYKSPVAATNKHANGSFQKEENWKNEVFIEQRHKQKEKKEMTLVNMKTEGTPEKNRSPRKSSESPSRPTFSMAVAGSVVDNAQSLELATMLAGQIARAAAIFRVDEIVVFDDYDGASSFNYQAAMQEDNSEEVGGLFMVRILKYLEVPQYLRRALIPMHRSLGSVGKLPPLDAPHHLRKYEWRPFREGVVLDKRPLSGSGSCVDVGLEKEVLVSQKLKSGERVTVAMGHSKADGNVLQVVDCETARQAGFYWGYSVRYASCLSAVFDECPFEGKYDFCIGTSEHGEKLGPTDLVLPKCKHLLVAFGGLSGLEESVKIDKRLQNRNMTSLFNRYINTCPNQGSRTIRTEEAILISLQFLQAAVQQALSAP